MSQNKFILILPLMAVFLISFLSAIVVDADYITVYPGEEGTVKISVDNNENFDIESVSLSLDFDGLKFSSAGSSEKDLDDLDEDDDDSTSFTIKASTDIVPGDYSIPYTLTYSRVDEDNKTLKKQGSFGIRVSAKTDLDYSLEIKGDGIVGEKGQVSVEVINKGLGEIRSVSIELYPQEIELLSKNKIFIGSISADDTDFATFDVIYKQPASNLKFKVEYRDLDNNIQSEVVTLPLKVYTKEQAIQLGIIKNSNSMIYIGAIVILLIVWFVYRRMKKRKNRKEGR